MVAQKNLRLEAFWSTTKNLIIIGACESGVLFLIVYLLKAGILELDTVMSVVLTEVGITIILYYLLGQHRREHEEEIVNLAEAVEKFSHLKGYIFPVFPRPFKYYFYYVENTVTNQYYRAPDYVEHMIDRGVIPKQECKNEIEMRGLLTKKECNPNEREAELLELLVSRRPRKRSSEQAQLL